MVYYLNLNLRCTSSLRTLTFFAVGSSMTPGMLRFGHGAGLQGM
jgi:hypothetical protein